MSTHAVPCEMIPGLPHHDEGGPPEKGSCEIAEAGGWVRFRIRRTRDGAQHDVQIAAPPDGTGMRGGFPGADTMPARQEGPVGVSLAAVRGKVIARAARRISGRRRLMTLPREDSGGKGGTLRIRRVHRRLGG